MASIVKIKRSEVAGNPATLAAGELAYSGLADNGSNGGDRLYVGMGVETDGDAANHVVIGGKFFTDMLDHSKGTLTANSAIITDASSKIDNLKVDNIDLNGNTISTTDVNGNLTLSPNGTGKVSIAGAYTIPRADGSAGQVLTTDGAGSVTFASPAPADFTIAGDSGTDTFNTGETLTFDGDGMVVTAVTNNTVAFSIGNSSITNAKLANTSVTIGTSAVALGGSVTDITGLLSAEIGNLDISLNAITALDANGNINLVPSGTGKVSIANAYTLPNADGSAGQVLVTNGAGAVSFASPASSSFTIAGDTGTDAFNTGETLTFAGDGYIQTDAANNTVTFTLGAIDNAALENSSVTVGNTAISLGGTATAIAGITQLDVDNIRIDGNTISSTDVDGNITLTPNGNGIVSISTDAGITGDLTISGDLIVNGTTTTVNSTTVTIDDKNLELGSTASPTDAGADGGGITLKGTTNKTFNWIDATDSWTSSEHMDLVSTKEFKIAGTSVLNATTLGSGVTASSLQSVATLTSGTWNATTITVPYGGTGATTLTSNGILYGNGTGAIQATAAGTNGYFLFSNAGTPAWTNTIDGGTY